MVILRNNQARLYDKLTSFRTLYKAFHKVRKHKKDNKFIKEFEYSLEENIVKLQQDLRNFTYRSSRMEPILIPNKPSQKAIFSPCLKDRVPLAGPFAKSSPSENRSHHYRQRSKLLRLQDILLSQENKE